MGGDTTDVLIPNLASTHGDIRDGHHRRRPMGVQEHAVTVGMGVPHSFMSARRAREWGKAGGLGRSSLKAWPWRPCMSSSKPSTSGTTPSSGLRARYMRGRGDRGVRVRCEAPVELELLLIQAGDKDTSMQWLCSNFFLNGGIRTGAG